MSFFRTDKLLEEFSRNEIISKIRDYLSKKERLVFYRILHDGYTVYKSFSSEDVELIKKEGEADVIMSVESDDDDEEWYDGVVSGYRDSNVNPIRELVEVFYTYAGSFVRIDLGRIERFYAMSRSFCDLKSGKITCRSGFGVNLTDDDYVFIIYEIMTHNFQYFFTDLMLMDIELAQKIYFASIYSDPYHRDFKERNYPFLITFDELEEDAREIFQLITGQKPPIVKVPLFRRDTTGLIAMI